MNKNAFRKMIDAWCKHQNLEHDSLLDELKERAAQSNIPQDHPLSNFISVLERGTKRLPDIQAKWITRRTLCECEIKEAAAWSMFKGEGAREEWKSNHNQTCLKETGGLPIQLAMIGEHHERCVEYASEYKIPQVLTDRVSDWIQGCVQGSVDFPTIREMLVSEHRPLFQFYGPPPRPLEAAAPEHLRCRAFHPSADTMRTFQRMQARMWQLDHDDFTSTHKSLKEAGVHFKLRAPACDCLRPKRQRHLCISDKCTSFRSMWIAPWQRKYLHDHTERKNFFFDATGQVNQYGYMLFTIMLISIRP
eukprot:g38542.t1